jgi:hypothetical protein
MRSEKLKSVTVYFNVEEFEHVSEEAADHGVTVSAYIRARLKMPVRQRGAPTGERQGHVRRSTETSVKSSRKRSREKNL